MPTINDLLVGYQTLQEARTSARRQAIINNADIWFGDLLGELSPGLPVVKSNSTVIPISYNGVSGEIYMDISGNAGLRFTAAGLNPAMFAAKSMTLPFYTWGKDRFATPADGQALAELLLSLGEAE
jgi:hypothetical protein